ncbi:MULTISPECIES: DUF6311 domain-containing protein [Roseomonadaceae]|uniref:Glycosyltransferase RgtA/B/C/D-like domain-containing protein n=1 Tax=Falsiroseomonas oleicola TaxID=2801474 RepID=A0ABS6H1T6_9PROT|nr:DUF6311 domain-containing protein [Roseomonas oleicola]MBU8542629.1 hypothetical protein [Roseomonas oleicola]
MRRMRISAWVGALAALAIGMGLVAAIYGWQILPAHNTGWMLEGTIGPDPVQYWLGWTYFGRAPWMWPPGANPDWGLEVGSSIFYSDSIPLLAFAFKALRGLVEVPQYWGMWLFACGALQALLAWRLIGLFTPDPLARLAGAALFVLQPILLQRMGGHFALAGQFLLLAALYLCLTPAAPWRRLLAWAGLMLAASLIHAYLLPMVAGLWATDWLARAWPADRRKLPLAVEALAVPGAGVAGLWAAGFFLLGGGMGGTWGGYGQMQLDLLAPFDPSHWGGLLPQLPRPDHLETADSYLGLGTLLLLAGGALAFLLRPRPGLWRHWPLLAGLAALLALAITHRISLGGQVVAVLAEPSDRLQDIADALRASVRFFWPVAYALILGAIAALAHALGGRWTGLVLAAALAVQVIDLRPGFDRLAHFFRPAPATAALRLDDPFWLKASLQYTRIRLAPTGMQARHWEEVAVLAATRGLPTDAVYLARIDPEAVAALNAATARRLAAGDHEPGSLYVLGNEVMLAAARAGLNPALDLLARFDDIWVLAPGWRGPVPVMAAPAPADRSRTTPAGSPASMPPEG